MTDFLNGDNQPQGDANNGGTGQQNEAPYAEYLNKLPESVRPLVEPTFKEWDGNVTKRFQEYSQQVNRFQPYSQFVDNYDPQSISQAIQLAEALQANPQAVYEQIAQAFGFDTQQPNGQGSQDEGNQIGENTVYDPRYETLEQQISQLTNMLQGQQAAAQEQQETEAFVEMLQGLEQTKGEFDWEYVLTQIAAGRDPEQAIDSYHAIAGKTQQQIQAQQNQANAPQVMGASGNVPSGNVDVSSLGKTQVQDLVANLLQAANRQGG